MAISKGKVVPGYGDDSIHPSFCNCELCIEHRSKFSTEKKDTIKKNNHEVELEVKLSNYTSNSVVVKKDERIEELVLAHWSYQERLLTAGQDKTQMFSWNQVMEMRRWDYCSSARHFYGHGYEDAMSDILK
jgi:hypothetical protein